MMSAMSSATDPFEERGTAVMEGLSVAVEPGDAVVYGPLLPTLVAFFDHQHTLDQADISAQALCADPSFGFIASQGG